MGRDLPVRSSRRSPARGRGWCVLLALCWCLAPLHAAAPPGRYVVSASTVQDKVSGRTWQRAAPGGKYLWSDAKAYCSGLSLGGFTTGWRLPTARELRALIDVRVFNPAIDGAAFPGTQPLQYWTSTPLASTAGTAFTVDFLEGRVSADVTSNTFDVRCVR